VSLAGESTLGGLMVRLAEEATGELQATCRQVQERSHAGLIVAINGANVQYLSGLDTPVRDGDTVSILPVVAGGCTQCRQRDEHRQ
jgi:molybdopterin converting factor small subunit